MWYPIRIKFNNLFSHVETEHYFNQNKTTVIFGENKTDKGFENNGAGKSTLLEAIFIAFTGNSLRDLNKEDFINYDFDWADIDFDLENPVLNQTLKIYRKFDRTDKSIVEITLNKVKEKKLVSVNEANKRIVELLGLTREDLLRYYIISQDSRYNFFSASDGDKKEITNRITSADTVNNILSELSIRFKKTNGELNELKTELIMIQSKIDTLNEQIEDYEQNDETANEIKTLESEVVEIEDENKKLKIQYTNNEKELNKINDEVEKLELKLKGEKAIKVKVKEAECEYDEASSLHDLYETIISGAITCPNCGEHFVASSEISLKEAEADIEHVAEIMEYQSEVVKSLKKKLEKYKTYNEQLDELLGEQRGFNKKLKFIKSDIDFNEEKITKKNKKIKTLKDTGENTKITELREKVSEQMELLEKQNVLYAKVDEQLTMIKYWQYYMGKSGFTTFLANKSIKLIEGVTNSFLIKFKTDINVLVNGFKVLKDGSVREKVEVFIQNNGLQAKKFMANSGGERGRVIMAGILGVQSLINNSLDGKGLNFLALDESFPGIDPRGQENMIRILERVNMTILLITQNVNSEFNVENKLFVSKVNGVSKYVEQ